METKEKSLQTYFSQVKEQKCYNIYIHWAKQKDKW